MTLPNGAAGVNTTDGLFLVSANGHGDLSAADLVGNDQATMQAVYKNRYVLGGDSVWSDPSGPLGLIYSTLGALPGVGFALAIIGALVNAIVAILGPIPVVGTIVETLASFLGLTHTTANDAVEIGTNAQASADNANVGVARLEGRVSSSDVPGGVFIDDTFDRSGSDLGTDYDQIYLDAGIGTVGTSSNNAHWSTNGSDPRVCIARHLTPLFTEYQGAQIVQDTVVATTTNGASLEILLRCNATEDTYVVAHIGVSSVEIGFKLSGTYTRLGAAVGLFNNAGDRWTFKAGTDTDDREFVLYQNTTEVCRRTDTGATSQFGTGYEFAGFVMAAGNNFFPPFFFAQTAPPDLQSFTAYDRLAAA